MPRNGNVESARNGLTSDERGMRDVRRRHRVVIDDDDLDAAARAAAAIASRSLVPQSPVIDELAAARREVGRGGDA